MHPQLFEFNGLFLPAYLTFQLLAVASGALWLHRHRARFELPAQVGLDMMLLGMLSVFVGGRLESIRRTFGSGFGVAENWYNLSAGGYAFFGVLWVGVLGSALYARYHKHNVIDFWDAAGPVVPLGLAVYRVGCLMAGCCYGTPTTMPWGIVYPETWTRGAAGVPVHPLPIYELLGSLLVYAVLRRVQERRPPRGNATLTFFVLIGTLRFITDFFRGDAATRMASWIPGVELTHAQWWCLLATIGSLVTICVRARLQPQGADSESSASPDSP